jgi:hypothetical protein
VVTSGDGSDLNCQDYSKHIVTSGDDSDLKCVVRGVH